MPVPSAGSLRRSVVGSQTCSRLTGSCLDLNLRVIPPRERALPTPVPMWMAPAAPGLGCDSRCCHTFQRFWTCFSCCILEVLLGGAGVSYSCREKLPCAPWPRYLPALRSRGWGGRAPAFLLESPGEDVSWPSPASRGPVFLESGPPCRPLPLRRTLVLTRTHPDNLGQSSASGLLTPSFVPHEVAHSQALEMGTWTSKDRDQPTPWRVRVISKVLW